jgi:hypothetical protein
LTSYAVAELTSYDFAGILGITDFKGGARTDAPAGVRLTENKGRPVAKENVLGEFFHAASNLKFGEIAPFTGDRRFGK